MNELDYTNINEWADFWFYEVGVNVIPIYSRNKGDTSKGFGRINYTRYTSKGIEYNLLKDSLPDENFESLKDRDMFDDGIAIVGGLVHRGKMKGKYLIMLDFDNQKGIDSWFPKGIDDAKNVTLIEQHMDASYKAHVYYYSEESCAKKSSTGTTEDKFNTNVLPLIEVKGDGTHGIHVVTPSIHADGHRYEIVSNVLTPQLFDGDLEIEIDKICQQYDISYLSDAYDTKGETESIDYDNKNLQIESGGGRRPTILRAIEHWLRLRQERLDDPELKKEAEKYAMDWNKKHCKTPLSNEKVIYQTKCAWNYIQRLYKKKELYPIKRQNIKKNSVGLVADKISQNHRFATMRDTREMLMFDESKGVYRQNYAESIIQEETEQEIRDCEIKDRLEVVEKIKVSTFSNRDDFDKDPNIIIFKNGVLNIKDMEFQDHNPNILATAMIPVNYVDPEKNFNPMQEVSFDTITEMIGGTDFYRYIIECFRIDGTVNQMNVFTVMESFASILFKTTKFEKGVMFIGSGENGKSVLLHYITEFIGEENIAHESIQKLAEDKFSVAELYGKLANIVPDIESNELRKSGILKELISGDRISAQRKHQHPFKFNNYSKLIYSANKFPKVFDQSDGFFRRFIIVKWERQFSKDQRDSNLKSKLTKNEEEKSKVLALLIVLGRRMMVRGRFKYEPNIKDIREDWNKLADPILMFINDSTRIITTDSPKDMVSRKDMWEHFKRFMTDTQINEKYSIMSFGKDFGEYFETEIKRDPNDADRTTGRYWIGVKIPEDDVDDEDPQTTMGEFD